MCMCVCARYVLSCDLLRVTIFLFFFYFVSDTSGHPFHANDQVGIRKFFFLLLSSFKSCFFSSISFLSHVFFAALPRLSDDFIIYLSSASMITARATMFSITIKPIRHRMIYRKLPFPPFCFLVAKIRWVFAQKRNFCIHAPAFAHTRTHSRMHTLTRTHTHTHTCTHART